MAVAAAGANFMSFGLLFSFGLLLTPLAEEFDGAFELAKIDVDANQELSAQFGIQSIPALRRTPPPSRPQTTRWPPASACTCRTATSSAPAPRPSRPSVSAARG